MSDVDATVRADDVPGTPARIMNAGTALSREVGQQLATVVERTFRRERLRRRTTMVTLPSAIALYAFARWANSSSIELDAVLVPLAAVITGPLVLHLLWGARNRALLDVAADDSAMSRAVLVDAVRRMQREGVGPSTALRAAQAARRAP